jgi:4-carboxymuconolactone decarboxylase
MTRIGGVPEREAGLLGRFAYRFSRRRFGKVLEPLTLTAHHPRLLAGYGAFERQLERSRLVDQRLKSLAETKVAATVGCEFCIDIGSALGRKAGVSEEQLRDLHEYAKSGAYSSLEKLVLEYAEEGMTRTPAVVREGLFDAMSGRLDEMQLVELTAAIAWENYRARFNHAFGIGSQGFSEGALCPLPEIIAGGSQGTG